MSGNDQRKIYHTDLRFQILSKNNLFYEYIYWVVFVFNVSIMWAFCHTFLLYRYVLLTYNFILFFITYFYTVKLRRSY